jgi:DtxR family transcriptional regulator, Mn-dependent transcriptional regulator
LEIPKVVDPFIALSIAAAVAVAAVLLLRPGRGLLWRGLRMLRATERVRIEDALKHLYDGEERRSPCTLHSLAGSLGIGADGAAALVTRLEQLGLVEAVGLAYRLTGPGRSYALRVVRIHRLLERYLADETGLDAADWHAEADYREHDLSPQQADALAARLGEPRFDPHGDPIPTASGEVVPLRGRPLTDLAAGALVRIVHVEDEPAAVYAQLVAERLHPGTSLRVVEVSPRRIRVEVGGEERVLAPVVAANLSVVPLEAEEEAVVAAPGGRLSDLEPGEKGRVKGIAAACHRAERRRFLDLGLVPGTVVEAELRSPSGDPTAYRVRGAAIALRREQADMIQIDPLLTAPLAQEAHP